MEYPAIKKFWNKYFVILCSSSLLIAIAQYLFVSIISIYVVSLGSSASFGGILTMIYTIASLFTRLVAGRLSDLKGRKKLMMAGAFIFACSTFLFRFFPFLGVIIILRAIQGIGSSAMSNTSAAAVADVLPKSRLGEGVGYYGLGQSIASAVGPSLALFIIGGGNFNNLFYITTLLLLGAGILISFCDYEKKFSKVEAEQSNEPSKPGSVPVKTGWIWRMIEKKALSIASIQFMVSFSNAAIFSFLTLYISQRSIPNGALFFTASAVTMFIARLTVGRITDKVGALPVIIPALSCGILSYVLLAFPVNLFLFYLSGVLYGICMGVANPALNASIFKTVSPDRRGAASSTYFISMDSGIGIGSLFWGILVDIMGYSSMFVGCAVCLLLAIGMGAIFLSRKRTS